MSSIKRNLKKAAISTVIGVAGLGFLVGMAEAINKNYKIERIPIPDPNDNFNVATCINNNGEVVGYFGRIPTEGCPEEMWRRPFIYRNGKARELKLKEIPPPRPHPRVQTIKINDHGDILVFAYNDDESVVYDRANNDKYYPYFMEDLNNNGDVVGYIGNYAHIFRGDEIIPLGGMWGQNMAMNDKGDVVNFYAFLWHNNELKYFGDDPPWTNRVHFRDINNNGDIVGADCNSSWTCRGRIWKNYCEYHIKAGGSLPEAINDNGEVVGNSGSGYGYAYVYDSKDESRASLIDLIPEDSEWEKLERAYDINNKGQIVGYGYLKEGGLKRGFLMTPIPLEGDFNDDNKIDARDFSIFSNKWLEDWNYVPDSGPPPSR